MTNAMHITVRTMEPQTGGRSRIWTRKCRINLENVVSILAITTCFLEEGKRVMKGWGDEGMEEMWGWR